jgi:hypothetical protein
MVNHTIETEPEVHYLMDGEAHAIFDKAARHYMKMSGDDFLARWHAGEFGDPEKPYRPELMAVIALLPLAE